MSSFYAVKKGISEGIYESWEDCKSQIDNFSGSQYKKFKTREEAQEYMDTKEIVVAAAGVAAAAGAPPQPIQTHDYSNLSPDQLYAFNQYSLGNNLFITGPGGTGKSYLIKCIRDDLTKRNRNFAVCALTGCAAVLLGLPAKTIHSWAGIGIASGESEQIINRVLKSSASLGRWRTVKTLIIDEVSMMSAKIIEILDRIGRNARKQYLLPFGGIQVIFVGDFYQLPPVGKIEEPKTRQFCFESPVWKTIFRTDCHIQLRTSHRQKDPEYIKILEEVRSGKLSEETISALADRLGAEIPDAVIKPTKLFPRNADVDRINLNMYVLIKEQEYTYDFNRLNELMFYAATTSVIPQNVINMCEQLSREDLDQYVTMFMENNHLAKTVKLKKGTIVMCLANLDTDAGICNGSQGVVIDFKQGKRNVMCPIVRFLNGVVMPIEPKEYQFEDYPKYGIAQIPLRHAWAFTIHKSQGVTLDIAEIDIGSRIFESGQTYVALSRVKKLSGIYLSGFNPTKIKTNPTVAKFYEDIPVVTEEMIENSKKRLEEMNARPEPSYTKVVRLG